MSTSSSVHIRYANPKGAVVTAMHGGLWCTFAYRVSKGGSSLGDGATAATNLTFSEGGQQCNRPEGSHGQILIEGVLEELDESCEFHFDSDTKTLTLWHNASSGTPPPLDGTLQVAWLTTLINATGSQSNPIRDLHLTNVGFRDTASATFEPHVAPTGEFFTPPWTVLSCFPPIDCHHRHFLL
jgi:hypothetical protein